MMIARRKLYRQNGFTLIELMIGIIVGLIVLSAVIYAFLSTLRSSVEVLNSTRLNMEVSVLTNSMTGELRRAGYWPVSGAGSSPYGASRDDLVLSPLNDCVLYSYYNDVVASSAAPVYRGFAWVGNELLYGSVASSVYSSVVANDCADAVTDAVTGGGGGALHPEKLVSVTYFTVSCLAENALTGVSVADCSYESGIIKRRRLDLSLTAEHTKDPIWKVDWSDSVYLPNDLSD